MSYPLVALDEVCRFVRGPFGGALKKESFVDSGFAIYEQQHAIYNQFSEIRYFIDSDKFEDLRRFELSSGDLIMSCSGTMGKVAKVPEGIQRGIINQALLKLTPSIRIDIEYLAYWMGSYLFQNQLGDNSHGAAIKNVASVKILKQLKIPLPPLAEQKKIAAILDAADQLRQKDQQLINHYTALSQSLFLEMFGDPVGNSKDWNLQQFGDCLLDIVGGKSVGGEERPLVDGEMAVLKISAVTSGVFNPKQYKVVEAKNIPTTLVLPKPGDLLFSRANTRELVGATCVVDRSYEQLFLPDKIWRLVLNRDVANNWYIKYLLGHEGFRENMRKVATGTSGSMLNISKAKLLKLQIPLPSIELQNRFAENNLAILEQVRHIQANLEKSETLFNSLLQKAFKGELTSSKAA